MQQGGSGFVCHQSVREDAGQRATAFCDRKGKARESLTETASTPLYMLGNFPRIEIVFDCIEKPGSPAAASGDDKYAKLARGMARLVSGRSWADLPSADGSSSAPLLSLT
jgi:hypothetical protein